MEGQFCSFLFTDEKTVLSPVHRIIGEVADNLVVDCLEIHSKISRYAK